MNDIDPLETAWSEFAATLAKPAQANVAAALLRGESITRDAFCFAFERVTSDAALRMEMALDHLQFMARNQGVREDCREGYKGAHDVIAPMFAAFVPSASAIRSRK